METHFCRHRINLIKQKIKRKKNTLALVKCGLRAHNKHTLIQWQITRAARSFSAISIFSKWHQPNAIDSFVIWILCKALNSRARIGRVQPYALSWLWLNWFSKSYARETLRQIKITLRWARDSINNIFTINQHHFGQKLWFNLPFRLQDNQMAVNNSESLVSRNMIRALESK